MDNYKRFFRHGKYSLVDKMHQFSVIKENFVDVQYHVKKGRFTITMHLQPTEDSIVYTVKMISNIGSSLVNIYVTNPYIGNQVNGIKVPHKYPDGSLCLYYNANQMEINPDDLWAETLVPWTALWLYYYEKWIQTGEWLGGGVH